MMNKLSLCMIVRDEEKSLPDCLASVKDVADEIILVDTGSEDSTVDIGKKFGAVIVEDAWQNDFSHSRNISLEHATCPWILYLDADDILPDSSAQKISKVKSEFPAGTALGCRIQNIRDGSTVETFNQIRIFPNHPAVRFQYRVHEQILPSIQRQGIKVVYSDITIHHTGYTTKDVLKKKQERNIAILKKDLDENPEHPVILFSYAGALADLERSAEAVPYYEKAYNASVAQRAERHIEEAVPLFLSQYAYTVKDRELFDKWMDHARKSSAGHIQLHFLSGRDALEKGEDEKAEEAFKMVLDAKEQSKHIPVNYKMIKTQACVALGDIYKKADKQQKAIEMLELAMRIQKE